jgi:hypothetical protein
VTRGQFISAVAIAAGPSKIAWTADNAALLCAWQLAEGSRALWNPWDTTLRVPHSTPYNAAGVQNYATMPDGIFAFLATLGQPVVGHYEPIREQLAAGDNPAAGMAAIAASGWGTEPFGRLLAQVLARPGVYLGEALPNEA